MTRQETFDIVVNHLRKQGRKAIDENGHCRYRTDDGCKCAAGCLIPDDKYSPDLEGNNIWYTPIYNILFKLGHDLSLVGRLQQIHDKYDINDWEDGFKDTAKRFGLQYTLPT